MRRIFTLSLLAPALMAQAPANPGSQSDAQKVAAEIKAIEAMKGEQPVEALERAKALLPAAKPSFDKTSLQTAYASIHEWNSVIDLYELVYNTGVSAGHFEEAKDAAEKARELAKTLQSNAMESFNAYKATWVKAGEESAKLLGEMKQLEAAQEADRVANANKPAQDLNKMTIEEANAEIMRKAEATQKQAQIAKRIEFLKANEGAYNDNVEHASKVMVPLERPMRDLEFRTHEFDGPIAQWDKYLLNESEDLNSKYKGDKAKYAAGLLRGVGPKPENVEAAMVSLRRAAFLDPKNSTIPKRIAQLMGKAAAGPKSGKAKSK